MFAQVVHGVAETDVMCRKGTIETHKVEVWDGRGWWEFSINPRVTTPWRIAVTCAAAVRYVGSKTT